MIVSTVIECLLRDVGNEDVDRVFGVCCALGAEYGRSEERVSARIYGRSDSELDSSSYASPG